MATAWCLFCRTPLNPALRPAAVSVFAGVIHIFFKDAASPAYPSRNWAHACNHKDLRGKDRCTISSPFHRSDIPP
eukprot:3478707-Rhodomonas_salina.5